MNDWTPEAWSVIGVVAREHCTAGDAAEYENERTIARDCVGPYCKLMKSHRIIMTPTHRNV